MANTSRSASQSTASTAPAAHKRALVIVESPAKAKTINKYLGLAILSGIIFLM